MKLYDLIVGQLKAKELLDRPQKDGWKAYCPAHEDNTPSLSVRQDENGGAMLKCFKGCSYKDIRNALDGVVPVKVRSRDVEKDEPLTHVPFCVCKMHPKPDATHPTMGRPSECWVYETESGDVWAYVCRFETERGKEIRPYSLWKHDKTGELTWKWCCPNGQRPLLDNAVVRDMPNFHVLVVEGEKAAYSSAAFDAFQYHATAVTTWLGGSSAVAKTDWSLLAGRRVSLLPDNDVPGRRCMWEIAEALVAVGVLSIEMIEPPPGVPVGWDIADPMPEGWDIGRLLENKHVGIWDAKPETGASGNRQAATEARSSHTGA